MFGDTQPQMSLANNSKIRFFMSEIGVFIRCSLVLGCGIISPDDKIWLKLYMYLSRHWITCIEVFLLEIVNTMIARISILGGLFPVYAIFLLSPSASCLFWGQDSATSFHGHDALPYFDLEAMEPKTGKETSETVSLNKAVCHSDREGLLMQWQGSMFREKLFCLLLTCWLFVIKYW